MGFSLSRMRHSRGYKNLLRGDASMLGDIQVRALHEATFLHGLVENCWRYFIVSVIILILADEFVRSQLGDIEFGNFGLIWVGLTVLIEVVFFVVARLTWRRLLKENPIKVAIEDANGILHEVRNSRGEVATVRKIAGENSAEFLCDFYRIKSWRWVSLVVLLAMFVGLCLSTAPRYGWHIANFKTKVDALASLEQTIIDNWQKHSLCDEYYGSDIGNWSYYSHYAKCKVVYSDGSDLAFYVDINEDVLIDNINYLYTIDREITNIPNQNEVNELVYNLIWPLETIGDEKFASREILSYNYLLNDELDGLLAEGEYKESQSWQRTDDEDETYSGVAIVYVYLAKDDSVSNSFYVTSK